MNKQNINIGDRVQTLKGSGTVIYANNNIFDADLDGDHGIYSFNKDSIWKFAEGSNDQDNILKALDGEFCSCYCNKQPCVCDTCRIHNAIYILIKNIGTMEYCKILLDKNKPNHLETYLETLNRLKTSFYDERDIYISEIWKDYKCKWFFPKYRKKQIEKRLYISYSAIRFVIKELESRLS